jgi:hypothetical protein
MAHDRDDRWPLYKDIGRIVVALKPDFHIGFADPPDIVSEFSHHQLRSIGINGLLQRYHDAELHQCPGYVNATLGHPVRQFLNRDGFRDDNVTHNLDRFLRRLMSTAFTRPAHGGQTAGSFFLIQRLRNGELATTAARFGAARTGATGIRPCRFAGLLFLVVCPHDRLCRQWGRGRWIGRRLVRRCLRRLALAQTLCLLGRPAGRFLFLAVTTFLFFAPAFLFLAPTIFFLLAGFFGFTRRGTARFGTLRGLLQKVRTRLISRSRALKRPGAGGGLFLGQRSQNSWPT